MFKPLSTMDGLLSTTESVCCSSFPFLSFSSPADQLSGCHVHAGRRLSHQRRQQRRGRCKNPGVKATRNGVWHFSHILLTSRLPQSSSSLAPPPPHTPPPPPPPPGPCPLSCSALGEIKGKSFVFVFYLWLSSARCNEIAQSCWGVILITD